MDEFLAQLMKTDDQKEVTVLLRKAAYFIQRTPAHAKALRYGNSGPQPGSAFEERDEEYVGYVTNSLVTVLLYYIDELKVLLPATDCLVALICKFPWLKEMLGQAGLYHNLMAPLKRQINAQRNIDEAPSFLMQECIMQLYLAMTYGSEENLKRSGEANLFGVLEQQMDDHHASIRLCLTNLKLLSFIIGKNDRHSEDSHALQHKWRLRCLLQEKTWSLVGVNDDHMPFEHEASILSHILWIMNSFLIDISDVQWYGLRCLSALLVEDCAVRSLWLGGAFDSALHACFFYIGSREIQEEGLLFMKNLLFALMCQHEDTGDTPLATVLISKYDMISQVVNAALHTYFQCEDIVMSACGIIQAVLMASDTLGQSMIEDGLPKTLLQMLPREKLTSSKGDSGALSSDNVRNHILSCVHLFSTSLKYCGDIAHSLLPGSHDTSALTCMLLFGTSTECANADGDTLLLSACLHSYTCMVECLLNTACLLSQHGSCDASVDVVKSCVKKLATNKAARSNVCTGLLLRYLAAQGAANEIDWKGFATDVFSPEALDVALEDFGAVNDTSGVSTSFKQSLSLMQGILNTFWVSDCHGSLHDTLAASYFDAVKRLRDCPGTKLLGQDLSCLFTRSTCTCRKKRRTEDSQKSLPNDEEPPIHFEDHLHISFDDSDDNDDSKFEMAVEDDRAIELMSQREMLNVCEACMMLHTGYEDSSMEGDHIATTLESAENLATASEVAILDISDNSIRSLSEFSSVQGCVAVFKTLEVLVGSRNRLLELPCNVAQNLSNLKELKLAHNCLQQFPLAAIAHCPNLALLDVSYNEIRDCDVGSKRLHKGHQKSSVHIYSNVADIREDCSRLPFSHINLRTLKMSHNHLTRFPYCLCAIVPKLGSLDLSENEIQDLSANMLPVEVSANVSLSHNSISLVPEDFMAKICKMKELNLSWNAISETPNVDSMGPSSLSKLNLSHNQITAFPCSLLQLRRLKVLNLSSNEISSFPGLSAPSSLLREIDLSYNKIEDVRMFLKRVVGTWAHTLRSLKLNDNLLQSISSDVGMLRNLEVLELHNNKLTTLPDDVGRLAKLYHFSLSGNDLNLDPALLSGRAQELRSYFYSRLKRSKERKNAQLIILSTGSCDRNGFMQAFAKSCTVTQKHRLAEGLHIDACMWSLNSFGRDFQLTVWDCVIQQGSVLCSHPELLLSEQAIYVILIDSNDEEDALEWLDAISAYATNCPVLVVELDQHRAHTDKVSELKRKSLATSLRQTPHSKSCQYLRFAKDSNTQANIAEFAGLVTRILEEHEVKGNQMFGSRVPENFIVLEEIICKSRDKISTFPVLSYSGLIDLIHNQDETKLNLEDGEDLMTAVRYLAKAGVIWHQDDPRSNVRNNFILEPLWLLMKINEVVLALKENVLLYDNKKPLYLVPAFLMNVTMNSLANSEAGTESLRKFLPTLVAIMQNRGVIFLVEKEMYFVPSFLPESSSITALKYSSKKFVWRILKMDFLPVDLWHRLIARLLGFLEVILADGGVTCTQTAAADIETVCWKTGIAMLESNSILFSIEALGDKCSTTSDTELIQHGIQVKVLKEPYGQVLLPAIMDHIENLVEECFPSLLEFDMRGQQHIQQYIPCPVCMEKAGNNTSAKQFKNSDTGVHSFELSELIQHIGSDEAPQQKFTDSEGLTKVSCPNHRSESVKLADNIPDVLMKDYDANYEVNPLFLLLDIRPDCVLGEGGFGTVFRGVFKGDQVAIKTLRAGSSTPAYRNLRSELNIMARLRHPSLVSLLGFMSTSNSYPAPLIVMELAQEGSLSTFLSSLEKLTYVDALAKFPRFTRWRVALQILEGLAFLHKNKIIFRDVKPDNVLLMSLQQDDPILVRLTDFGIAIHSTPSGTIGASGSPGYSAPEVVALKMNEKQPSGRKVPYTEKCDMFSYGLLLHEIAVCRTPWFLHPGNSSAAAAPPNVPDEAVLKGILPAAISTFDDSARWPYMQEVISNCLKRNPDDRLSADDLLAVMRKPQVCCFRKSLNLGAVKSCIAFSMKRSDQGRGATDDKASSPVLQVWTVSSTKLVRAQSPASVELSEGFPNSVHFAYSRSQLTYRSTHHKESDGQNLTATETMHVVNKTMVSLKSRNESLHARMPVVKNLSSLKKLSVNMDSLRPVEQSSHTVDLDIGEITSILEMSIPLVSHHAKRTKSAVFSNAMNFWASLETGVVEKSPEVAAMPNESVIFVGTREGTVAKFHTSSSTCSTLLEMRRGITCLHKHSVLHENETATSTIQPGRSYLLAGISDGRIAFLSTSQIARGNVRRPDFIISLVESTGSHPVIQIVSSEESIFALCGKYIVRVKVPVAGPPVVCGTKMIPNIPTVGDGKMLFIKHLAVCHSYIYATLQNSCLLLSWNTESAFVAAKADIKSLLTDGKHVSLGDLKEPLAATSLLSDSTRCVLYVGLNSGHVVLLRGLCSEESEPVRSFEVLLVIRRHEGVVWKLFFSQDSFSGKDVLLSCGDGSRSMSRDFSLPRTTSMSHMSDAVIDEEIHSYIAIYDAGIADVAAGISKLDAVRAKLK